jgi:hypothetical protein
MLRWAILGTGLISHTVVEAIDLSDASTGHLVAGRGLLRNFWWSREQRHEPLGQTAIHIDDLAVHIGSVV